MKCSEKWPNVLMSAFEKYNPRYVVLNINTFTIIITNDAYRPQLFQTNEHYFRVNLCMMCVLMLVVFNLSMECTRLGLI